jgi:acyl carrier protein
VERAEFLAELGQLFDAGKPLTGTESLGELGAWNSLAWVGFMALADEHFGLTLTAQEISRCATVNDLLALVFAT